MDENRLEAVSPRIVMQILLLDATRRVWVARNASARRTYCTLAGPTRDLPQFRDVPVSGLMCAETPAGRERLLLSLAPDGARDLREISIDNARSIARRLARNSGAVVHLALFDEPHHVVWEPVHLP